MGYFKNVSSLEELKRQNNKLALENHPDVGGENEIMQKINAEYNELSKKWKTISINNQDNSSPEYPRVDYALFGLPIGLKIIAMGYAGAEQTYCVISKRDENGNQKIVLTSEYYEGSYFGPIQYIDNYTGPYTQKFGIGFYYDDVDNFIYAKEEVEKFTKRAYEIEDEIIKKEEEKKETG